MSALAEERVRAAGERERTPRVQANRISPARLAAFEILVLVSEERGHSDELLHGRHLRGLSAADKNLATTLVMGVLRWQIALDARVRVFLQKPNAALATPVAVALRMGAFQLLHLDRIPAHAALSESVELARHGGHDHAAGMVNAVLRKVAAAPAPGKKLHESAAAFAERLGHPAWMVERWVKAYGRAEALAVCEADQREPSSGGLFADGDAMPVMDDGSRLVAELAAACAPAAKTVWDCCAAPGGKTLVMAKRLSRAALLATDASPRRVKALTERLAEAGAGNITTAEIDALALPKDRGRFDLILCDVPCSGTGTLARNPEIRQRLSLAEIARQAERQRAILAAALQRLAVGGRLVYATCSLEREECEDVVTSVLERLPNAAAFVPVDLGPLLTGLQSSGVVRTDVELAGAIREGALRTLSGVPFEGDGFYARVLERLT